MPILAAVDFDAYRIAISVNNHIPTYILANRELSDMRFFYMPQERRNKGQFGFLEDNVINMVRPLHLEIKPIIEQVTIRINAYRITSRAQIVNFRIHSSKTQNTVTGDHLPFRYKD